jgi:hypothetical protein
MERSVPAIDKSRTFHPLRIAVLTISDTRTPETDTSGRLDSRFRPCSLAGQVPRLRHVCA